MGNIVENPVWEETVFQVETTTPLLGGSPEKSSFGTPTAGYLNVAQQQLANRTQYLKDAVEAIDIDGLTTRVDSVETNLTTHIGSRGAAHTNATQTEAGFMSATDKTKLNGVSEGAQVNTVTSVATRTGDVTLTKTDVGLANVDNTTDANKPVSTAQQTALNLKANIASPTFTGTPIVPTASAGASTTQVANTAFVAAGLGLKADLASPALTGTPTTPTATAGTNNTQIASTAFVTAAVAAGSVGGTNLGNTPAASTVVVTSSTGASTTLPSATTTTAGVLTAADKLKIDGISASGSPLFQATDQRPLGTAGGSNVSGSWQQRTVNTTITNQISGASLSSNTLILPAGTYYCELGSQIYGVDRAKTRIYNSTNSTVLIDGLSVIMTTTVSADSTASGQFTLSTTSNVIVQYWAQSVNGSGLGLPVSATGTPEKYLDIKIWKLS
jgi:hypothetical protein